MRQGEPRKLKSVPGGRSLQDTTDARVGEEQHIVMVLDTGEGHSAGRRHLGSRFRCAPVSGGGSVAFWRVMMSQESYACGSWGERRKAGPAGFASDGSVDVTGPNHPSTGAGVQKCGAHRQKHCERQEAAASAVGCVPLVRAPGEALRQNLTLSTTSK